MGKKTTAFARKRARGLVRINPHAATNALLNSAAYNEEVGTMQAATLAKLKVTDALSQLRSGLLEPDNSRPYDLLAHACGVSYIRALQIAGVHNNPMLPVLDAAEAAMKRCLERRQKQQKWGLDGPAIQALQAAVDVYCSIVSSSSPNQMEQASKMRQEILARQSFQKGGHATQINMRATPKPSACTEKEGIFS